MRTQKLEEIEKMPLPPDTKMAEKLKPLIEKEKEANKLSISEIGYLLSYLEDGASEKGTPEEQEAYTRLRGTLERQIF